MKRELNARLRKALERVRLASDSSAGMYPGEHWDMAPTQHLKLQKMGFVKVYVPHNPAHKERAVITPEGRAALTLLKGK